MEAICIILCLRHQSPKKGARGPSGRYAYTARWKLIVSDYHAIRMRLMNSQELLEGTSLALYDINQTTLVKLMLSFVRTYEFEAASC